MLRSEGLPEGEWKDPTSRWGAHARSSKAEWGKVWGALESQSGDPRRVSLPGMLLPHARDVPQGHGFSWRLLRRTFRMRG